MAIFNGVGFRYKVPIFQQQGEGGVHGGRDLADDPAGQDCQSTDDALRFPAGDGEMAGRRGSDIRPKVDHD